MSPSSPPPSSSSFEALQERLTALQETTGQLKELIERLATIKFQPGSVPLRSNLTTYGGSDESNAAAELGTEINQILREEEEELELLHEEIIDLPSGGGRPGSEAEHKKLRLKEGAQRLGSELKGCRTSFRKAQLAARRSLEGAQKLERELLLSSYAASAAAFNSSPSSSSSQPPSGASSPVPPTDTQPTQPQLLFTARDRRRIKEKGLSAKRDENGNVIGAASDVTDALRRTHELIAAEVSKSAFAARTLAESADALRRLDDSYEGIDGLLGRSRDLLGTLLRSQKSDTWYLQTALYMLFATLVWLVFRRLLYGPLWWLVWLPVRTVWRGTGLVVGSFGGSSGDNGTVSAGEKGGATMLVRDREGGKVRGVGVGEEGAVPTVLVGGRGEGEEEGIGGDPDSLVDKVGRIIEDSLPVLSEEQMAAAEANRTLEEEEEEEKTEKEGEGKQEQPNPMKRMWEEEREEVREAQRVRDEL
ncbi:Sec20-domain-containing protein [Cercophora scortea]|uniref:Sec20-domain-containing protein n=1 Tax=Cercophora scortea TaxID=314031 RepID=A0AAE0MLU9_9PEZI|nr:Sec20-domain-containing protein [Cercophora scortea]